MKEKTISDIAIPEWMDQQKTADVVRMEGVCYVCGIPSCEFNCVDLEAQENFYSETTIIEEITQRIDQVGNAVVNVTNKITQTLRNKMKTKK